jgi:hypothetical protein
MLRAAPRHRKSSDLEPGILERIMSDTSNKQNPYPQSGSSSGGSGGQQQQFRDTSSTGQQSSSTGSGTMGQQSLRGAAGMGEQSSGRDLKDRASDFASSAARDIKERASGLAETAKGMASGAQEKLLGAVEEQKKAGAQQVRGIAQAVRTAADGLESEIPQAAQYVRRAAEQIDYISDALERRDMGELVGQVQDFARRHPTAFLGATVIAGFALIRFLKSSAASRSETASGYSGYGERGYAGASDQHRYAGSQYPSSTAQRGGASYAAGSSGSVSSQGSGSSPRPSTSGPTGY